MAWLHANRKRLMIGGGVVAAIALVAGLYAWQKGQDEINADAQLLNVPLVTFRANQIIAPSANSFLDVAKKYPDTSAGEYAALLAAGTLFTDGKYPEAHQQFSQFIEKYPDSALLSQAKVGLAACLEGEGKISEAAQQYQSILAAYSSDANIATPVKLTLARLDEMQNKPEQALNYYIELARINNPNDPWVAEARERGEMLIAKHPELRKAVSPAAGNPSTAAPSTGFRLPAQGNSAPPSSPSAGKP